jgi:putative pre-16S rRNA nuclease
LTGVVLGIDPGSVRVGVAVSDPGGSIAFPLTVIQRADDDSLVEDLAELVKLREASEIVVGLPRRLDGTDGPEAGEALLLAKRLRTKLGIPVHLVDERYTSKISETAMRSAKVTSRKQRPVVDKIAATVLLQGFLDSRSAQPDPPQVQDGDT